MKKLNKYIGIFVLCFAMGIVTFCTEKHMQTVYAYTEEEKEAVKAWLSANGYPPTMEGAEQAYQDYLDGKLGPVGGNDTPADNNSQTPPAPQTAETTVETAQTESVTDTEMPSVEVRTEPEEMAADSESETEIIEESESETLTEIEAKETSESDMEIDSTAEEEMHMTKEAESEFQDASETETETNDNAGQTMESGRRNIVILLFAVISIAAICFIICYCRKQKRGR